MATTEHYFIELNPEGKYAVRAEGSERASALHDTQEEAIAHVRQLNPADHPDASRVRHTEGGKPDQWRKA